MATWPTQANVRSVFGEPGSPAATAGIVNLPYQMVIAWDKTQVIKQFRCHRLVEAPLERIFQKTLAHYGEAEIKRLALNIFGGCYNYRPMRGSKSWSMHAFGIAVDLDPEHNQLKWGKDKARFAKPEYLPFWKIVESEGAVSLGRAANRDFMHFQFARL